MRAFTKILSGAVAALALTAAAPSQAAVFAQFTPDTGRNIYSWVNNAAGNNGTGGAFFTTATPTGTTVGATNVHFSFLALGLTDLQFVPVKFTLNTTVASGSPATFTPGPNTWTQTNVNGGFSFIYTGVTKTFGAIQVLHNANLLSGAFTDAWIQGNGGTGSTNLSIGNGGAFTSLTSDFNLGNVDPSSEEFALNLLGVTPAFGAKPGKALKSFRANGGGNFSLEILSVPEPATWTMMLMGFGGMGAMIRRRRAVAFA